MARVMVGFNAPDLAIPRVYRQRVGLDDVPFDMNTLQKLAVAVSRGDKEHVVSAHQVISIVNGLEVEPGVFGKLPVLVIPGPGLAGSKRRLGRSDFWCLTPVSYQAPTHFHLG